MLRASGYIESDTIMTPRAKRA